MAQNNAIPRIEELKNENHKNKHSITCRFCKSLILRPNHGDYAEHKFDLPLMHQKNSKDAEAVVETESLADFWIIPDMFIFENIGFSNTVDNIKYLICADCEMGPIGYHETVSKKCFLAIRRVTHGDENTS